ncbi:unnamed protein product [Cylicocyclus nassatus]|uniref:Uncharacterized protein n=1 Tax=Cylicocyclus nassatus TaxID=53992 RepID=A0AA36GWA0_CYLNA|nr:unnamed protein product [Cylicocyclus nassatus]
MYAKLLTVTALFVTALCITAQTTSALDDLKDGQVCAKELDKNETMAEFRKAFPDAATEVESYLGLLLDDKDGIKRYTINFHNPEWTSMYVNVLDKTSEKNYFLRVDLLASDLWSAYEVNEEEFKKWKTACQL